MPAGPIFDPALEVYALDQLAEARLVRFAGKGNEDELAFTAVEELEGEDKQRLLIVLDRKNSDGETFPPMVLPEADTAAQAGAVVFPEWRIQPVEVVVTNAESNRDVGIILASGAGDAHLVASQRLDHGRDRQVGVRLGTGDVLGPQAFQDWKIKHYYVAVTKWELWVPHFSDGERPRWKSIFKFPKKTSSAKS